jgi:acyl carrier protein phosphodiesterase
MNWLAHFYLSKPDSAFRIGNVLPDMLRLPELEALPVIYQEGIARHRAIDSFTDSHPVVRRSIARFSPRFRRFGGVFTDVFYDHFLVRDWDLYNDIPLNEYIEQIYASFEPHRQQIPPRAFMVLEAMKKSDWIGHYGEIEGIEYALKRMEKRLKRPFGLGEGIIELQNHYEEFHADFREFFPELRAYVDSI